MAYSGGYGDYGLETLKVEDNGAVSVPQTRMRSAGQVQDMVRRLWWNDEKRSKKRSLVNGLVGGFPPYRASKMRDAGMAQNCNANWGTGGSYMENASGAFYDLFSEAPGVINIRTSHGNDEERDEWSRVMSEESDRAVTENDLWDYEMQRSQWEMTLHGCGPLFWEDAFRIFPRSVGCGDFKVVERTRSDINYFELASIDIDYYPPQLYEFIKDPEYAPTAGWDVDYTQRCIANAMDIRQPEERAYDWEFYQQEIKNNSLSYYDDSKVCHLAFVFWKEFDGRITQVIVERESTTGPGKGEVDDATGSRIDEEKNDQVKYLFKHVGRYDNFQQAVAAMYFDRGNGGFHHSVTGLGVKMYSAMEYENRLICRLMDGAFAPKVLFKPTSTEATQKMQLTQLGHHGVMPPGWDAMQSPIGGFIQEGLSMYQASSQLMRSNLSSYRQQVEPQTRGNPETKYGRQLDAFQQSALNKTTFNRYYKQLDTLYREMVRRMFNINTCNEKAKEIQKRCQDRGVPKECFGRIESVEAVRVIGEGSSFLRKSTLSEMFSSGLAGGLPEEGQNNLKNDMIAAMAGQRSVLRYNPPKKVQKLPSDQQAMAMLQVAAMKLGQESTVTSSQSPLIFAVAFLQACQQAIQSLQKGANPMEVLRFLNLCGPACMKHIKRMEMDPTRKAVVQQLTEQMQGVMQTADKLKRAVQAQQKQRQAQMQKTQQAMSDQQIKAFKVRGELALKAQKTRAQLAERALRTRQDMTLNDARTASDIHRQNALAAFSE